MVRDLVPILLLGLLAAGAISVLVWSHSAWAGILLIPVYGFVQQAVVFEPLRTEALNDGKTGLLRYEPWRATSTTSVATTSCTATSAGTRPWCGWLPCSSRTSASPTWCAGSGVRSSPCCW